MSDSNSGLDQLEMAAGLDEMLNSDFRKSPEVVRL